MSTTQTTPPPPPAENPMKQKVSDFRFALSDNYVQSQLQNALAENSSAFVASLVDLVTSDKYLLECDPKLVILQAMKAAILKLPVIKSLNCAYIVAYNKVPTFQIGYRGLLRLAIRTGQYKHINADVVYEGEYRSKNKLTGEFDLNGDKISDNIIGYFAHFEQHNGFSKTLYMTKEKVAEHAQRFSKTFNNNNSPWKTDFNAMSVKTVLRLLLDKWGEMTIELANILQQDDDNAEDEINRNANKEKIGFSKPINVTANETGNGDEHPAGF